MKKIVIIGGGVSGISAGIYALQQNLEVEIYEKNNILGGECTGWYRDGYMVDNCMHWLTGCRPGEKLRGLWNNLSALGEDVELYHEDYFYKGEFDGVKLCFWRNAEKAREEFLAVSPEDTEAINDFFDSVKRAECVVVPIERSMADMGMIANVKFSMSMAEMGRVIMKHGKEDVTQLAEHFRHPAIRKMICNYYEPHHSAISLITSYGFFTSGSAALPKGGSIGLVKRMRDRFEALGGKVYLNSPVSEADVKKGQIRSIVLENGEKVKADAFIFACDPIVTFNYILDKKYTPKKLRKLYTDRSSYPVASSFTVAFGIAGTEEILMEKGSVLFSCDKYTVADKDYDFVSARLYDHDKSLYPDGKRVIQCTVMQNEKDYNYWRELHADRSAYISEKKRISEDLLHRLTKKYPGLEDKLIFLSACTPITFKRYCGAFNGSYMSFIPIGGKKGIYLKSSVPKIKNAFLASQWLQPTGGLPLAAVSGKFAIQSMVQKRLI